MSYKPRHRAEKQASRAPRYAAASVAATAAVAVPVVGSAAMAPASAADDSTWDKLAQCESGGDWSIDTGNGFKGGLQFTQETWSAFGGTKYAPSADQASRSQQIATAEKVLDQQGWGAWPSCSSQLGLTESDASGTPSAPDDGGSSQGSNDGGSNEKSAAGNGSGGSYTVQPGDTLSKIAQSKGIDGGWRALYQANKADVSDPTLIFEGDDLQLPA